jgi:hypothetical protein
MAVRVAEPVAEVVATALGREHREDPDVGRTGGPAGNARLTAWVGLLLLIALLVEVGTLLSLGSLIEVHIVVGVLIVALVLLKTASTGWRMLRYYLGNPAYRRAGPPPLLLRLLGPLVVVGVLAVLGTGLALIALGRRSHSALITIVGFRVDAITLHQAAFLLFLAVTIPHVLTRTIPALQIAMGKVRTTAGIHGRVSRGMSVVATLAAGAVAAALVVGFSGSWLQHGH